MQQMMNFRTGNLEPFNDDNLRDYIPQTEEILALFDDMVKSGHKPIDAMISIAVQIMGAGFALHMINAKCEQLEQEESL